MTLFDISFRNEAHYQYKNSLVTVSQIEEQDSRTRRTELMVGMAGGSVRNSYSISVNTRRGE